MSKHSNREKSVMLHLQKTYKGIRVWRMDSGMAFVMHSVHKSLATLLKTGNLGLAKKQLMRVSYGVNGWPDLTCIYLGIFIGIEIKVGRDRQREDQKAMESTIEKAGGIYILLDDKSPIESQLKRLDKIEANKNLILKVKK